MPRPRPGQRRRPGPSSRTTKSSQPSQPHHAAPPPPAKSTTDFEICLYDIPRFRPGTTPPQPPLSLLPVHDTDAFIIGKLMSPFGLPDEKDHLDEDDDNYDDYDSDLDFEERRRRALQQLLAATAASHDQHGNDERHRHTVRRVLNYVVGWPDVPYARRLVPCTEVLDYVSPRTLEAWEYAATLREHEAAAAAAARKKGHKAQKTTEVPPGKSEGEGKTTAQSSQPAKGPQRKRRRRKLLGPTKKRKTPAPPPAAAAATEAASTPAPAKTELQTLSGTPTPRQIKPHTPVARPGPSSDAAAAAAALTTPASDRQQRLVLSIPSLASGKQRTGLSLSQPYRPTTATSAAGSRPDAFSSAAVAAVAAVSAARARVSTTPRSSGYMHVPAGGMDMMDVDELATDDWENEIRRSAHVPPTDGAVDIYYGENTAPAASIANSTDEDDNETDEQRQHQNESAQRITYIPPPTLPYHFSPAKQRAGNVASLSTVPRPQSQPSEGTSASNTLKRKRGALGAAAAQEPAADEMNADDGDEEEQIYDEDAAAEEEEDDELYEVEAIENDYMMESDESGYHGSGKRAGKGQSAPVRFLLVRWKGDWPPDQNPTWEPAENLPPGMVRQYLKRAARHKAKSSGNRNAKGN